VSSADSLHAIEAGTVVGNFYDKYASTNPVEQRMMRGFFTALDDALRNIRPSRVLEVGAGEGQVLTHLVGAFPAATVIGLDLMDAELQSSWADLPTPMLCGDATRLPFADDTFDTVVALEVLEHIADPLQALREIARVCRDTVIVSVPREPIWRLGNMVRGRYVSQLGNTPGHLNHWSSRSFRHFVDQELDIVSVAKPLPWTMISARVRSTP
jgi:ubiquinone/menaquinone biosynthesis C-methylase UbiE